jgi:hypothetical protein
VPASLRSDRDDYYVSETFITIKSELSITIIGIHTYLGLCLHQKQLVRENLTRIEEQPVDG